jgi:predicted nucleic acid-binding protein
MLLDANIFMYAGGRESPQREPCRRFLRSLVAGEVASACTNAEVLQEILHRYRALGAAALGFAMVDSIVHMPIPVLPITEADVLAARRLMESYPDLSARDAVHLGVMRENEIETILSYDRGFSRVPWADRREP